MNEFGRDELNESLLGLTLKDHEVELHESRLGYGSLL